MTEKPVQYFLQVCTRIEETVGAIYRQFATSVPADDRLHRIWSKMAEEEDEHAVQLRFAGRLPASQVFRDAVMPTERVEQLLEHARAILARAKSPGLTAAEALQVSLQLERDFLKVHVGVVAALADRGMQRFFQALGRGDEEHIAALEAYAATLR